MGIVIVSLPSSRMDYANRHIGDSRWIQYRTSASDPTSSKRLSSYARPHTLRVVFTENGRRYVAEKEFAATYPLITIFHLIRFSE